MYDPRYGLQNPTFIHTSVSKFKKKIGELEEQLVMAETMPLKLNGNGTVLGRLTKVNQRIEKRRNSREVEETRSDI